MLARIDGDDDEVNEAIEELSPQLSVLDGVAHVDASTGSYVDGSKASSPTAASARFLDEDGTWLSVAPSVEPVSERGEELVRTCDLSPLASRRR